MGFAPCRDHEASGDASGPLPWTPPLPRTSKLIKLAPCGRTVLVDLVPDSPPIRTGHDGQRICDERLGLTSAVLPAWAVSWALTTPRPLCLLAGYLVAGHNVPA